MSLTYEPSGNTLQKKHGLALDWVNPSSISHSFKSKYQYFPEKVIPYIHFTNLRGLPQHIKIWQKILKPGSIKTCSKRKITRSRRYEQIKPKIYLEIKQKKIV